MVRFQRWKRSDRKGFFFRFHGEGFERRIKAPFDTLAEAELWARRVTDEINRRLQKARRKGGCEANQVLAPKQFKRTGKEVSKAWIEAPGAKMTFAEFVPIYLRHADSVKAVSTVKTERNWLRSHLVPALGEMYIWQIDRADIANHLIARMEGGIGNKTRNRILSLISTMFQLALELGYVTENPAKGIRRYKEVQPPIPYVPVEIQERFIARCPDDIRPLMTAAIDTGMRQGELLRLEWTDIHFDRRMIHVRESKNKTPRDVPMTERLLALFFDLRRGRTRSLKGPDRVFRTIRTWGGHHAKKMKRAARLCGIRDNVRFHDMRHWFTTNLVRSGVPFGDVKRVTGHKTDTMMMRYAFHSPNDAGLRAIQALEAARRRATGEGSSA